MSLEIEKNFYKYNEKYIKKELKNLNAQYKINLLMTYKKKHNGLTVRVRDEGFRKTFTIKNKMNNNEYNKEYQVNVSDINETLTMLKLLGLTDFAYQEKIRETYFYKNSEICFDYVPGQENFLQIESKTQDELYELCDKFFLDKNEKRPDFQDYFGIEKKDIKKKVKFKNLYKMMNEVTKNNEEYTKLLKKQLFMYKRYVLSLLNNKKNELLQV
tara:strand:+ start:5477 stop:6118 length:642 start_codon:yes stop_codon:yes gene_type:complete